MPCLLLTFSVIFNTSGQATEKAFDGLLTALFPKAGPGGSVLIAKEGQVLYHKAFGMADLELNIPMNTNHVFRLGSITKQFTAVCILKLAEEGKLSLQDELTQFIPDYPAAGQKITIAALLSHTSGVKNYTGLPAFTQNLKRQDLTPLELIALFKDQPLDFDPGSSNLYSNSGYILLGYIIEKVSGMSYARYVQENIFTPLGMNHSGYDAPDRVIANRIAGYRSRNGNYENAEFLSMSIPYAAGSLLSTTGDLFAWYEGLAHHKVISKASLALAHTSYRLADGRETGYGFGWEIGNVQDSKSLKHTGVVNGFVTHVLYLPTERILVALLSNYENIGDLTIPAAMALGKPYYFRSISLPGKVLNEYHALYTHPDEGERYVVNQDGELVLFRKGGNKTRLVPCGQDLFYLEHTLTTLQFNRDPKGAVRGYQVKGTSIPSNWQRSTQPVPLRKRVRVPVTILESYTGKYLFEPKMVFEVLLAGGSLFGRVGQDQKELIHFGKNKFYAKDLDAILFFNGGRRGYIKSLTKIQNSRMQGKRME